jgi:hypothetical protein
MQTRIWNRNCEKRRFEALLESRLAFWLRRGLGSDIRACACNGIRSRSGLSLARRSLTQSDAVARQGHCRFSAKTRQHPLLQRIGPNDRLPRAADSSSALAAGNIEEVKRTQAALFGSRCGGGRAAAAGRDTCGSPSGNDR